MPTDSSTLASRLPAWLYPAALLALATGCAVGPDYKRPDTVATTAAFKEAPDGWKQSNPSDASLKGDWWTAYNDPVLNDLEAQAAPNNQSLAQLEAEYEYSRQLARADRTGYLPTLGVSGTATRARNGEKTGNFSTAPAGNTFVGELDASWEPDLWGRIRRTVEADEDVALQDAATFANARLSVQATLATDYIELRILDEKRRLLDYATDLYQRTLTISQNKYTVGVVARSDIISAQAQLDATRAQAVDTGVQRAQLEHAIAVLIGKAPSDFAIAVKPSLDLGAPTVPGLVPSQLLERRPDIASAERATAAANARIGIQTAAYYPTISLSATGGYQGSVLDHLLDAPNRFWSLGGSVADSLIDWGQRHDEVLSAKAAYNGQVANYRQVVLTAFQQVEDQLAALRILGQESEIQDNAVKESVDASRIALNEYRAGTVDYTTVVTAQVTEITDKNTALTILQNRLVASVSLVSALGGGWSTADLPSNGQVLQGHSEVPK